MRHPDDLTRKAANRVRGLFCEQNGSALGFITKLQDFREILILQRLSPYMARKGRCNSFNMPHNFRLKSILI
ncbi:hypothetical protein FB480_101278 [Agrobacterium vitis]|nr:hypothetical protein FB480_101278 [Agrobacterium vitis]